MDKGYTKVSAIYKKLRTAELDNRIIYISGAVGFGKTAAVEYYFRKKAHAVFSARDGYLQEKPPIEKIRQSVIIIDDISWLTDSASQKYVLSLIHSGQKQIVLIGRGGVPVWLKVESIRFRFLLAGESDLVLQEREVERFFAKREITLSKEEMDQILYDSYGHALTLLFIAQYLRDGAKYKASLFEQVRLDLFHYYDHAFYKQWDYEMREVLLAVCQYPTFTVEMTEMITGNNQVHQLLEKAMQIGTFLQKVDENTFAYRIHLRRYLIWKQNIVCTKEQIAENYERAALFYEIHDQIEQALHYYQIAGNQDRISALLIKNAEKHPGTAHFFETREYYYQLPEQTILKSPVLMSGMSMLCAITLQTEESARWYQKLVEYAASALSGSSEQKEAEIRLASLDIALPQNGIHGMIRILKDAAVLRQNKNIQLPELSVTGNMPSVMNGGLDFCEWSRNDRQLAVLMKKPVELVLGKYGVGLVNIALAESGMEKGTMSTYDVMTRLNSGYLKSDTNGKIEMCFVATALMIREHISQGQMAIGEKMFFSFREKVKKEKANQLIPNIATFYMWMRLVQGDTKSAEEWLSTAPDENIAFCILDRYHYINKVRCHIAMGRMNEALNLIERLNIYFESYERHYLWMENQILKSIVLYRMVNHSWQETLTGALKKAERYHFVRVFSREGMALLPLLLNYNNQDIPKKFWDEICNATEQMAMYYPNYLAKPKVLKEPLTDTETKILKFLCDGLDSQFICELCGIKYDSLKFHNKNIYRKLGVNCRAEAEREAKRMELV